MSRLVALLIAARWPLLAVAVVIAAMAWRPAQEVRFDRSIENMFADDDPLLPPYQRLKEQFGGNEIVMAVYRDPDLLHPDGSGLARVEQVSRQMSKVEGVRDTLSLAEVNGLLEQLQRGRTGGGLLRILRPRDKFDGPAILNPDSEVAAAYRELFSGYTHSQDGQTVAVVCMLEPPGNAIAAGDASDADPRARTIDELHRIITNLPDGLAGGVLAGEPVMVVEGFAMLEEDGQRLGRWSTILLGLTILVCFRSIRWLIAPIAVVQWALLVTQATLVWSGLRLSMVSSMLTAIVTVVGVATVVHLIVRCREMRDRGQTPREALQTAGTLLAVPIALAILTDAVGFGSLWWASVGPVQDFGTMMVLGSLLVMPAVCLVVPAVALAFSRERPRPGGAVADGGLSNWLAATIPAIRARPKTLGALLLILALLAAAGVWRLEVESDFTRNFRADSDVVRAYEFVENNLGGAGVWDVIVPAPAKLDREYAERVRRMEDKLRALELPDPASGRPAPALTKVISVIDAIEAVEVDRVLAIAPLEIRYRGMAAAMPAFTNALLTPEIDEHGRSRLRIMLRARERQPAEQKRWLIDQVARIAREEFPGDGDEPAAEVTGFFVLLTNIIESLLRDQWTTFGIAAGGIFAMMLVAFRSLKLALVAMVPNVLPIFVVLGLLGWLGLKMNMGAAMIAAVSMGLSIDSSIHYLASFRREKGSGLTVEQSLIAVQRQVGQAVIFSTLALIVGFSVLCTSEFVPTIYFGALVSLAMLGGLLGNLVVLPLLLSWVERDEETKAVKSS